MRNPDWPNTFTEYVSERANEPFSWGENDCAMFAAGAIKAMTGMDFGVFVRGHYKTERGSKIALTKLGFSSLIEYMDALMERAETASRGDIVLSKVGGLAVVVGPYAMAPAEHGLAPVLPSQYKIIWSV